LSSVYNFGTVDTGSSGSNLWFWIFNNWATGSGISDALLSSSGQTYAAAAQLGLGHHASGSASHLDESLHDYDIQSGSFTGSVWASFNYYMQIRSGAPNVLSSGSITPVWITIYSGSSGNRLTTSIVPTLTGSSCSGSGILVSSYVFVQSGVAQGSKTGSWCLRYQYT
jgi:hypothetical protein